MLVCIITILATCLCLPPFIDWDACFVDLESRDPFVDRNRNFIELYQTSGSVRTTKKPRLESNCDGEKAISPFVDKVIRVR